ncbi:MAG: terminase family protein, partial [Nitrospira sp.]|nr:terminase family protein [Nitrospira sp.]
MGLRGPGAKAKKEKSPEGQPGHGLPWGAKGLSRPERVIRFIEGLRITSGMDAGKPFKLRSWQKKIIRAWYRQDRRGNRIVRTGLLTMARKNGKTVLIAALGLCHLIGPESEQRGQVVACAADRDQSGLIFDELCAFIEDNEEFLTRTNIKRHEKIIEDSKSGSKFKALSSDAKKSHGLNPSVVIFDELAQWGSGIGRRLYDALVTATGARKEPLTIVISTQSDDDHSLMSELVDHGKAVLNGTIEDDTFSPFVFEVPDEVDLFNERNWKLANPALGDFRSLEEMRTFANRAKMIPSQLAVFRNLYLNQRVSADERWITADLWNACAGTVDLENLAGQRCFGGLDLGSVRDLTAFA